MRDVITHRNLNINVQFKAWLSKYIDINYTIFIHAPYMRR